MLPMCFSKEELVSYPVDQDRIPTAVRAVSGPVLYADHRARACFCYGRTCIYFWKACVSGMSLCLLVQGFNPLNLFQYSSWPCHCCRATIVEFTIEFGKVPSCDSHNLCLYLACTSFTFGRSVFNQRLIGSIPTASFFTVRTTTVLERNTS